MGFKFAFINGNTDKTDMLSNNDYGKGLSTLMASMSMQHDNCGVRTTASPNAGALCQLPP